MFEDYSRFDPQRDSKVPLQKGWFATTARGTALAAELLFSRHPSDLIVWSRSMIQRHRPLSFVRPWLTFDATRAIEENLPPHGRVFEFGAGNSTIHWAARGMTVWAVDDNEDWHGLLSRYISAKSIRTVKLQLAKNVEDYANAIRTTGETLFDLVLVDGAFRRECVRASVPFVKPGGMLVVDNTDWHWFKEHPIDGIPDSWEARVFPGFAPMIGHRSETTVFFRPRVSVS